MDAPQIGVLLGTSNLEAVFNFLLALGGVGLGAGLAKLIPLISQFLRDRQEGKIKDRTTLSQMRQQDRDDLTRYFDKIIQQKDDDYQKEREIWSKERDLWVKERKQLIDERNLLASSYNQLVIDKVRLMDEVIKLQGLGAEGSERMDPILVLDRNALICWANESGAIFLGYPIAQLLGRPVTEMIPAERHAHFWKTFREVCERLDRLPPWMPLRKEVLGYAKRRDGTTVPICVILNGFRIPYRAQIVTRAGETIDHEAQVLGVRAHLRQRWEDIAIALSPPYIPLNSDDGMTAIEAAPSPPEKSDP